MKIRALMALALAGVMALIAGCSSGANGASGKPVTVNVTLSEFSIKSSRTDFKVGVPYHFVITNKGKLPHELMIMPKMKEGMKGMDMEELDKLALATVEEDDLPADAEQTLDVTFDKPYESGQLEMSCHIKGHYEGGMHVPIAVQ